MGHAQMFLTSVQGLSLAHAHAHEKPREARATDSLTNSIAIVIDRRK